MQDLEKGDTEIIQASAKLMISVPSAMDQRKDDDNANNKS